MEKKTDMVDFGTDLDKVVFNFRHITTDEDVNVSLVLTKYIETSRVEIVLCFLPKNPRSSIIGKSCPANFNSFGIICKIHHPQPTLSEATPFVKIILSLSLKRRLL